MDVSIMFFVPLVIFMIFVAPIWVFMHYRTKARKSSGFTQEDYRLIERLEEQVKVMEQRIHSLEQILDVEAPDWRRRYER